MRLEDMLKNVSGITNRVIKENCWDGQFNVLEGIQVLQSKINEIILAINNGIIKGDKGDTPNVQVGSTETLEPGNNASVTQTGDVLNPILNFSIPKGDKGDKGDTGKASESIQDNIVGLDTCWSSQKTVGYVDNMFNSLQDVKGVKYTSDKDYFVASGSKNGVVKDLKISGKSLVNRFPKLEGIGVVSDGFDSWVKKFFSQTGNTLINCTDKTILANLNRTGGIFVRTVKLEPRVPIFLEYGSDVQISQIVGQAVNGWTSENKNQLQNILMLDGDCRSSCPDTYFEGITSVGNGNEIEVSCVNENLFDGELRVAHLEGGTYVYREGIANTLSAIVKIDRGGTYYCKCVGGNRNSIAYFKDIPKPGDTPLKSGLDTIIVDSSGYLVFYMTNQSNVEYPKNIMINFGSVAKPYVQHKRDKKPILFKDIDNTWKPVTELMGINSSLCDTVESSKYNKKLDEIILDETLNYTLWKPNPNAINTIMFSLQNIKIKRGSQFSPISNLLVNRIGVPKEPISTFKDLDKEGVGYWDSTVSLFVSINKSQLETQDVTGFKKLLKKWKDEGQPLRIIYEKEVYEEYEVNPLDLESYDNETMILFKYGVVNGSSEFYIDSNLGSITIENMKRLSRIENEIYQVKKIVLNGDYRTMAQSTYPEDFKEVVKYE